MKELISASAHGNSFAVLKDGKELGYVTLGGRVLTTKGTVELWMAKRTIAKFQYEKVGSGATPEEAAELLN